jgi:two-component system phosphate regulon sensor histidine kinase PhoR
MNRKKLKFIVALMVAAVAGLIAIQIYWIVTLIKIEEERFNRTVNDALFYSVQKLEKKEVFKAITQKASGDKDFLFFVKNADSTTFTWNYKDTSRKVKYLNIVEKKIDTIKGDGKPKTDSLHIRIVAPSPNLKIMLDDGNGKKKQQTNKNRRKILVQEVVTELINENKLKPIHERINPQELNNILKNEFENRGIDLQFSFGIKSTSNNLFSVLPIKSDSLNLANSKHSTFLFPEEIIGTPSQLLVYFPNVNSFIISKISLMLIVALLLTLVISGVFYKTVQMFLQQKRITEIKNDLINNITHEFKTPLSTISLACEALNEPALVNNSESLGKYASIIREENIRLQTMVDSILNAALSEKESFNLKNERVDIHDIIRQSVQKISSLERDSKLKINLELNAAVCPIWGDSFHLNNMFSNLFDNSIKYNQNNPTINISTHNENQKIIIRVSDNGIGISKEHINKIFDSFYRVQSGNIQNVRGNGIGLSYVKKIVIAHGGIIRVNSEPGKGSTFIIELPISR